MRAQVVSLIALGAVMLSAKGEDSRCYGDIPSGRADFYDHSKVIPPYKDGMVPTFDDKYRALMKYRMDQFITLTY